ncbi:hypothetical protein HT136_18665 [Novosphingobium profundi]|uniref:hypothetical protein n=1 Tax=Novosphingobium profundi TaxID=1774954 RepID=UPI001BDB00D1|nr:hypothetical protein [Novosphingobium profundi]MBT0670394.1 hypothetical protein [Novosphingobium profundi]
MTDGLNRTGSFAEPAAMPVDTTYSQESDQAISTADLARSGNDTARLAETRAHDQNGTAIEDDAPLFPGKEAQALRSRWEGVQAGFVDEPRRAVEDADALVASAMKRLAESFASERATLEGQWDRDGEASTEDLRQALKRYRAFFGRLLAV